MLQLLDPVFVAMGAEAAFDYTNEDTGLRARLGRCYELAAKAFIPSPGLGNPGGVPRPKRLVHGSWHGPDAPARIKHAWVILEDGRIWEPITALICDPDKFSTYCRTEMTWIYSGEAVSRRLIKHRHYGPWSE